MVSLQMELVVDIMDMYLSFVKHLTYNENDIDVGLYMANEQNIDLIENLLDK
jgi:hypothetical protein